MDLDDSHSELVMDNYVDECSKLFQEIVTKCKDEQYMQSRLIIHLRDILPNALINENKNHIENEKRKISLEKELSSFQTYFLATNLYYFSPSNSTFYLYDGVDYKQVKEDDIIYKVLSTVTYDNKDLIDWKHKTKVSLIKKIKDRTLMKNLIPETKTIQRILGLLAPTYFRTKNEAKYFLTCIGDNLLKKPIDLTYYVSTSAKQNMTELEKMCSVVLGINNISSNFVSRHNENVSLSKCRLIKMRDHDTLHNSWIELLQYNGLNLLCVAAYYSNTHGTGDAFLEKRDELCEYALFLKNNNRDEIIDKFCSEYIEVVKDEKNLVSSPENLIVEPHTDISSSSKLKTTSMSWKNMQYIWKKYLSHSFMPSVVYVSTLKTMMMNKYHYNEEIDSFMNITSRYLPIVSDFLFFWNTTMKPSSSGNDYEVDELCTLFQKFVKDNMEKCVTNGRIVDDDILNILRYYLIDIEIIENKYVLQIDCSMWNKGDDIISLLQEARVYFKNEKLDSDDKTISFDDLYKFYLRKKDREFTMGKTYFEKFIDKHMKKYIVYSRVISETWIEEDLASYISNEISSLE
jgi:hypothetical protein